MDTFDEASDPGLVPDEPSFEFDDTTIPPPPDVAEPPDAFAVYEDLDVVGDTLDLGADGGVMAPGQPGTAAAAPGIELMEITPPDGGDGPSMPPGLDGVDTSTPPPDGGGEDVMDAPPVPPDLPAGEPGSVAPEMGVPDDAQLSPTMIESVESILGVPLHITVDVHISVDNLADLVQDQAMTVVVESCDMTTLLEEVVNGTPVVVDVAVETPTGPATAPHVVSVNPGSPETVTLTPVDVPGRPDGSPVSDWTSLEIATDWLEDAWSEVDHQVVTVTPGDPSDGINPLDASLRGPLGAPDGGTVEGVGAESSWITLTPTKAMVLPLALSLAAVTAAGVVKVVRR